jgi:uncharacterized protein with PhoU and TrkA domain
MDDRPSDLRTMLSEAKDTSELMVDLAYAAVYFGDPAMAEEVDELEDRLSDLVHEMRAVCVLAARSPGGAGEVVVRVPVAPGSSADGRSLSSLSLETETGFYLLAIRRGGRYLYRPRDSVVLRAGDELLATGPDEGHPLLTEMCGYTLIEDDETGADELVPSGRERRS